MREDGAILSRRMVNLTGQDLAGGPYNTLRHDYDLGDEITSNAATLLLPMQYLCLGQAGHERRKTCHHASTTSIADPHNDCFLIVVR